MELPTEFLAYATLAGKGPRSNVTHINLQFELNTNGDMFWSGMSVNKKCEEELNFLVIADNRNIPHIAYVFDCENVDIPEVHPREKQWDSQFLERPLIKISNPRKVPFNNIGDIIYSPKTKKPYKESGLRSVRKIMFKCGEFKEEERKEPVVLPAPLALIRTELVCVMYIRMKCPEYKFTHNRGVGGRNIVDIAYRPDLRMELQSFHLITEIDENGHRGYRSDKQRELDIAAKLMKKCVFIRYNPDGEDSSLDELIRWIRYYMNNEKAIDFSDDTWGIVRHHLFYD